MGLKLLPLVIGSLFASMAAQATIYKWVDENGQVHYSDKPQRDAETVEFEPSKISTITLVAPKANDAASGDDAEIPDYEIELVSPEDDATVRNNSGQIALSLSLTPELLPDHRIELLVDGEVTRTVGGTGEFSLDNLDRGEHALQARVIDKNGKVLASSNERRVFLHRHSRLMPQGTPAPTPNPGSE